MTRPPRPMLAFHHVEARDGNTAPTVVFLPGYASDMTGTKATALEAWARATGHAHIRFDYGGCGASEGAFADQTLADWRDDVLAMMSPAGVGLQLRGRVHTLTATPRAATVPAIWLLGSSDYSARLAAAKGLPYVFAHHFSGQGTAEALELYRSTFRASGEPGALAEPRTFLTVNASVAESAEEARRLALPQLQMMLALRSGQPLTAQHLVEEAEKREHTDAEHDLMDAMARRWIIGDPAGARAQLRELATTYDVDEVMVHPVAGAWVGAEPGSAPAREATLRLLAPAAEAAADWSSEPARP